MNGLQLSDELHGTGGIPLVVLHGGLVNIELQFGQLLPGVAATRLVIAADVQGQGRTGDLDRPLTSAGLAGDVVGCWGIWTSPRPTSWGSALVARSPSISPSRGRSWSAGWSCRRCRSIPRGTVG